MPHNSPSILNQGFRNLNEIIIECRLCPRLVAYRETVPFRTQCDHNLAWRRPVPGFGDVNAWLLILGLAPSVEGGNRTGRIFTGDASAKFLMRALFKKGLASQSTSESIEDGLQLKGCYITAAVKCVPPQHLPLREEFVNCSRYFDAEFFLLKRLRAVLALGKQAFDSYQYFLMGNQVLKEKSSFSHAQIIRMPGWPTLYGSYHPSPQNTNTRRLTEEMFLLLLDQLCREG